MSSNTIQQGDKVMFLANNRDLVVGHVNDIFDDVIIFQNQDGLFFADRYLAEMHTVLIEKWEDTELYQATVAAWIETAAYYQDNAAIVA